MTDIAIVDYGMCNLDSVRRALEECGASAYITESPSDLEDCTKIVLPGVGAFPDAIENLKLRGLDATLKEQAALGIPILGICLGMQLLATTGEENGAATGLDLIPGRVTRLQPTAEDSRIPHVGWSEVVPVGDCPLFTGFESVRDFYFVHSYRFVPEDQAAIAAQTPYAGGFVSAIAHKNVYGVQFHPEKSQRAGFALLRNFIGLG